LVENSQSSRWITAIVVAIVVILGVALFLFEESVPVKKVSVTETVLPIVVRNPQVKLKVYVTACQKLNVTIPFDAGFVTQSDDMRIAKGYVENIGEVPVQFVQVQIIWKDKNDKSVDASTVFAITNDVLAPGESARFQTSKRNYLIARCNARVTDWWVVTEDANHEKEKIESEIGE